MTETPRATVRPLPLTVDELTPEWLSVALASQGGPVAIRNVDVARVIWGTATKAFLNVDYAHAQPDLPARLCVKGGFDERVRAFGSGPAYELEASFYRDLAPALDVPLPRTFFADVEDGRQGVIVFEDLTDRGVTFGNPLEPLSTDQVAAALTVQARWHAQTWDNLTGKHPWLTVGAESIRGPVRFLLEPEQFDSLSTRDGLRSLSGDLGDPRKLRDAYQRLWNHDDTAIQCLSHNDAHIGQTYFAPDGSPAFLDWQGTCLAPWANDVAYFVIGALDIETRRANERELLSHYCSALTGAGGPDIGAEDAWREYRRHALHGFVWQITPTVMQPIDVVAAMSQRYVTAIEDLGSTSV